MSKPTITMRYYIEDGPLAGTYFGPVVLGWTWRVQYPHRKSPDLYVVIPDEPKGRAKPKPPSVHCCQEGCPGPDFAWEGMAWLNHIEKHAGRLLSKRRAATAA